MEQSAYDLLVAYPKSLYCPHPALIRLKFGEPLIRKNFKPEENVMDQFLVFIEQNKKMITDEAMRQTLSIVVKAEIWTALALEPDVSKHNVLDPVSDLNVIRIGLVAFHRGIQVVTDGVFEKDKRVARYDVSIVGF